MAAPCATDCWTYQALLKDYPEVGGHTSLKEYGFAFTITNYKDEVFELDSEVANAIIFQMCLYWCQQNGITVVMNDGDKTEYDEQSKTITLCYNRIHHIAGPIRSILESRNVSPISSQSE